MTGFLVLTVFFASSGLIALAHRCVHWICRIRGPEVRLPALVRTQLPGVRVAGRGSVRVVGKLLMVRLAGTPEEIGAEHAILLHDEMVAAEAVVWRLLTEHVRNPLTRRLLLDLGQIAYRNVASGMPDDRRRELAASAAAFRPDPFADRFDTYQRFVYLNALYDISLGYEASPLVGCTTFTFSGEAAASSPLLARAFDFDADEVFDEKKAVFLVNETGRIPFASVAWPGLVGVVSGMNRAGLAVVVHGARGGPARTVGEPVVQELRRLLSSAATTAEALRIIGETEPLVSHVVVVNDADGYAAKIERVPGSPPFVQQLGDRGVVTNHLEGPFATDPRNLRIRESTSTLARHARGSELVQHLTGPATAEDAVRLLRDREGTGGATLPLGDRRAIDALIATHGVVMETATRRLWVSEAPHLLGRFVAFELDALLDPEATPDADAPHATLPEDALLTSADYAHHVRCPPLVKAPE